MSIDPDAPCPNPLTSTRLLPPNSIAARFGRKKPIAPNPKADVLNLEDRLPGEDDRSDEASDAATDDGDAASSSARDDEASSETTNVAEGEKTDGAPGTPPAGAEGADTAVSQSSPTRKTLEDLLQEDDSMIPLALEPKVFAPFRTRVRDVPRRVQIERKKRKYRLDGDLDASLRSFDGAETLVKTAHDLPLEFFDDWDAFETRSNAQWLERDAIDAPNGGVRARCAVYPRADRTGFPLWTHCSVVRGDPSVNAYDVRLDKNRKILPNVSRVDLCFDTEDPCVFAARRHAAYVARASAVAGLRADFYVDNMPAVDSIDSVEMDEDSVARVVAVATNGGSKRFKEWAFDEVPVVRDRASSPAEGGGAEGGADGADDEGAPVETTLRPSAAAAAATGILVQQVKSEYARAMSRCVFDDAVVKPQHGLGSRVDRRAARGGVSAPAVDADALIEGAPDDLLIEAPERYDLIVRSKPAPIKATAPDMPPYDFTRSFGEFAQSTKLTKVEAYAAEMAIAAENAALLRNYAIFRVLFTKSVKLEEFEGAQKQALQNLCVARDKWIAGVRKHIVDKFKTAGKGWFNLKETDQTAYNYSKLKRFIKTTQLRVEDTLRSLAEANVVAFRDFILERCEPRLEVVATNEVRFVDPGINASSDPLFTLDLVVKEDAKKSENSSFQYTTQTHRFEPCVLDVFENGVTSLHGIKSLEPGIMSHLHWTTWPVTAAVQTSEALVSDAQARIASALKNSVESLNQYYALYETHLPILRLDINAYVKSLLARDEIEEGEGLRLFLGEIASHRAGLASIVNTVPRVQRLGAFRVQTHHVREFLIAKYENLIERCVQLVADVPMRVCEEVCRVYKEFSAKLVTPAEDPESVKDVRDHADTIPLTVNQQKVVLDEAYPYLDALEAMRRPLDDALGKLLAAAQFFPRQLVDSAAVVETQNAELMLKFQEDQAAEQDDFWSAAKNLETTVSELGGFTDMDECEGNAGRVEELQKELKELQAKADLYNSREGMFGAKQTDYGSIKKIADSLDPFYQFWTYAQGWRDGMDRWRDGSFTDLDAEAMDRDVTAAFKVMFKMGKSFNQRQLPDCAKNCDAIRAEIEAFRVYVPLALAMRSPGMRDRHWEKIEADAGVSIPAADPEFTFGAAIEMGVKAKEEAIVAVCDVAGKEYGIETALEKMHREWEGIVLEVKEYKETGTYVIRIEDEHAQMLDDQIVMTQAMSFSPFKAPFADEIDTWEATLRMTSDVLEEWLEVQRSWQYLEPIFGSDDIMEQLPLEGKRFGAVDRQWRKTLVIAEEDPGVIAACNKKELLELFRESNRVLDGVQKGLAEYLEMKRLAFSRFFFLSNDELLQIVSQTKNALAVQPHLRKCFEAVHSLDFEKDLKITAMNSVEGEKVPFAEHMYPTGPVEIWLGQVQRIMIKSCRQSIIDSLVDYQAQKRAAWVKCWPAMTVLAVGCTYWTSEGESAIKAGKLAKWFDKNISQLDDLTDLVRGKLSRQERGTLGALIVIDVHARDVVTLLRDQKVTELSDFDWVAQLRYYWENRGEEEDEREHKGELYVKMVQATLPFGYEYLGNQPRLVVTPLTDRCYMTLMGAMHLNLGGAPAGPAGTGKTETTKDLAKALAMQCVVFNCSDGLDYLAMAKFFKGLASSGAWACFDEFNRINLEVLSVVAQQILTIQIAIQQKQKRFIFENTELDLDDRCCVFITMNPGYAGRSELPDNLKALFRPCAMMVPDYALIGEISMMSFGFKNARPLAKKMVATFKLCSEQLSAQDHYDYGMRAVKSVITAAGNLKRDFPEDDEEILLLRGLMDVNVPKFLAHDLPLFKGIISDLFPGSSKPEADYKDLMGSLSTSCAELGIQPVPAFIDKVIQMYEMTLVRHGLMLVGPTGGGKTMNYRALSTAMTRLAKGGSTLYNKVKYVVLNPKSITMGQLYGDFDPATHEWEDGVLACYMRDLSEEQTVDKKWLMFDGPVDAIWIENMNTVLDDNKKLCLVSGEIIQMSATMTMMFEVEDLAVASPATVSRCGMIYMEPTTMGFLPLLNSYLQSLPDLFQPHVEKFREIFESVVPGMDGIVFFMRKTLKETVPTVDTCLVQGAFNLMASLLKRYVRDPMKGDEPLSGEERRNADKAAVPLWIFSMIWSLCASVTGPGRPRLDDFLRKKAEAHDFAAFMPPEGKGDASMYEYCYDQDKCKWVEWMTTIPEYKPNPDQAFASIIVPTADTVRYTYVIDKLLLNDKHVLCVGDTGTGKTLNVMDKLNNNMPDLFVPMFMTFSARTSANQTQDFLDSKMDKRRKGVFGPPMGKKYAILIDDFNMPMREKYFAQPPIELLRQWMDHGGWYERHPPCPFRRLQDMILVGCMGPPGGGRNPVSNRMLRHFNFLSFTDMSDESSIRIFDTILNSYLSKKFDADVAKLSLPISEATVQIYNTVRADLLPTPAKSHYTFNLRDLARVFQGLLRLDPRAVAEDKNELYGLWMHENLRVFQDRMVNNEDREWFRDLIDKTAREKLGVGWDEVVALPEATRPPEEADNEDWVPPPRVDRLIYGDYMIPGAEPRVYQRVKDRSELQRVVEEALDDYNGETTAPMKLVMFLDAIEHVSRICRVIRLPLGNALLLGVGGSGRQSLTRLAAALEEFDLFSIEVAKGYGKNEWRDDLRKVLLMAGAEGTNVVFLFTDTQIVQENFLEDINNILNSGEVPNLWKSEDVQTMTEALRPILQAQGLPMTKNAVNTLFITRVRSYLHCVLAMSPVSDEFRQRLRMFPSLVNCCTIDWFSEWPLEALESVADTFLGDASLETPELLKGVVDTCVFIHQSVERKSTKFFDELRRFNYVTPTSYLELLQTFIRLVKEKREEINLSKSRLQNGLDKLSDTEGKIDVMKLELVELGPVIAKTTEEVEAMIGVIKVDTAKADETKAQVLAQEEAANAKAAEAQAIADDAQADLDKALPALDQALNSLKLLTKADIVEVKAMRNPPAGVRLVMEVVCIIFGNKPKMVEDKSPGAKPGAKVPDYWDASSKMVQDPVAFLSSLLEFDKDGITAETIEKVEPYIQRDDFKPEIIQKVSKACTSICKWGIAMYTYYMVSMQVAPKRAALKEAQDSLENTKKELAAAKVTLAEVEAKVAGLNAKLDEANGKKKDLQDQSDTIEAQLKRAAQLIGGLGGEKVRWNATIKSLEERLGRVVGDVVISAGVVAYSGPFTPSFRTDLLSEWSGKMASLNVPHTPGADITSTLADPVQIRSWNIAGLPSDGQSVENGIIVAKARRWPLMIDPQGQANKWIKNMCKDSGIDVIKLSNKDYLRTLANAIRFGRAVLLENIGEQLAPALEPLLQKQTFKQGGSEVIKMGDDVIPYHPDFRFYMTTKMRNPHYQPEVSVKVSLLNFFVTLDGLEDQLLGTVVMQERRDLAEAKNQLVVSNARMKAQLKDLEDKILYMLSNSEGNILDDEELINTLAQSKVTSDDITEKVAEAEVTERDIDQTREKYRPVATRASVLFFCISDLAIVDPMYQYSLAWFISLFIRGIEEADKPEEMEDEEARAALPADDVEARIVILNEYFTYSLYNNICRSLFERHKLMFSLLLCVAIMQQRGEIDAQEWRFLLAGPTDTNTSAKNPAPEWVTEKVWIEVVNASNLSAFAGFADSFTKNVEHYREYFESGEAHRFPLDDVFNDKLNEFQKLLVIRCIRPDRFMLGVTDFVSGKLGQRFIEPPPFDLEACFSESRVDAPLIFVLSSGADPMADLLKLCEEKEMLSRFDQVSLGQGQGPKAEAMIEKAMEEGMWVCLQNCHLAESWMPSLDVICETIDAETVHPDFRLWLSAMPSPAFPVAILQNGIKMTLEPPKGLKANLIRSYTRVTDEYMDQCKDPASHKRLLFSICLFHAVIQDRRKFGPLGWNIRYDFTDGDLNMCQRQIKMMIDDYEEIPYKVIRVLCGEINYGGRVTDSQDRRLMNNMLNSYIIPEVLTDDFTFSPSPNYPSPKAQNVEEFVEFIKSLPLIPQPEIFGLHENADITCDQNETYSMFETILSLQPRVAAGGGLSREDVIGAAAKDIFERCPHPFDIDAVGHKYPTDYNQSMNTVLTQECIRYNNMIVVMRRTLQESLKALKGLVVMTDELEAVTDAIFDNQVPDAWASKAYPSLKPLSSWVLDLLERIQFIEGWIEHGPPPAYWISGLFFPQAFLTGTLQNYARKNGFAIDSLGWNFVVQDTKTYENTKTAPEDGCYITGFFLEGARWDYETHMLTESRPKELYTDFPLMWLEPCKDRVAPAGGIYNCPAYKTLTRAGVLSTTGHSTNFVMYLEVPTDKSESHWINNSVALFTALMF